MKLECMECGRSLDIDAEAQKKILRDLTLPAHVKVIECRCGRFQWGLAVRGARNVCANNG